MKKSKQKGIITGLSLCLGIVLYLIVKRWLKVQQMTCENAECYLD